MARVRSRELACAAVLLLLASVPLSAQGPGPHDARLDTAQRPSGIATRSSTQHPGYTPADVEFMQHMIGHHAQALAMTALIPTRTTTEAIRLLGQRITISQQDEIALMRHWLEARGEAAPDPSADAHAQHQGGGAAHEMLMPGMLTAEQMGRLAAASGPEFDRLFLEYMIQHHEGALTMVKALFATPGAAQDPTAFRFASDVDTDQRAEIARMRAMLAAMPAGAGKP